MEKRLSMLIACLFLCLGMALAQNKVSGTVVSADDGEPIIGASIRLVGTNFGAVTDVNPSPKVEGIIEILGSCLLQRAFSIGDNL